MVKQIIMSTRLTLKTGKKLFEGDNDVVDHKNFRLGSGCYQVAAILTMIKLITC